MHHLRQIGLLRVQGVLWRLWLGTGEHYILPDLLRDCKFHYKNMLLSVFLTKLNLHPGPQPPAQTKSRLETPLGAQRVLGRNREIPAEEHHGHQGGGSTHSSDLYGALCRCLHRDVTLRGFREGRHRARCSMALFRLHGRQKR